MRSPTYKEIAKLIAEAESDAEREQAGVLLALYYKNPPPGESTKERMA